MLNLTHRKSQVDAGNGIVHIMGKPAFCRIIAIIWFMAIIAGFAIVWKFDVTAGPMPHPSASFPTNAPLAREAGRATLVMMLHPHCPCSRASMTELEKLMGTNPLTVKAHLVFSQQARQPDVSQSELWKRAVQIPHAVAVKDSDGTVSSMFGAHTSGEVFLYDADGIIRFAGGITASRGHEGDSDGRAAIQAVLDDNAPAMMQTPVFGCSLR